MASKHTHKYYRTGLEMNRLWACALPTCNHHMPKHYEAGLVGKLSICWSCDSVMILTTENMKQDKPTCPECAGLTDLSEFIDQKLVDSKHG